MRSYEIQADGFEIVARCLTVAEIDRVQAAVEALTNEGGKATVVLRNLLRIDAVAELAISTKVLSRSITS